MKILFVEDDLKIAFFVKNGLQEAGFVVDHLADGESGLYMALNYKYDAAIVDLMLPKLDGLTLIKSIRSRKDRTPVLILSARRSLNERIEGLEIGADDYLTKPFSFAELLARLKALLRRANPGLESSVLTVSNLTVDLSRRKATRGENAIELQPLEFKLLVYLMRNGGQIVSKTMIMENVWEYDFNPETNVVESRISYLRDKIDKDYTPKLIHTIRGVGYVFEDRSQYT